MDKKLEIKLLTVDANISAGKSTLLSRLEEYYLTCKLPEHLKNIIILFSKEPIDEWEKTVDSKGVNILEHFYDDQKKYSFVFQINSLLTRLDQLEELYKRGEQTNCKVVIISERSLYTDCNIFESMLYEDGIINDIEHKVYHHFYNRYKDKFPSENHIYVRTEPEICLKRLINRSRSGESSISLEYLNKLHTKHEEFYVNFLSKNKCLVIENNGDETDENINFVLDKIKDFIGEVFTEEVSSENIKCIVEA